MVSVRQNTCALFGRLIKLCKSFRVRIRSFILRTLTFGLDLLIVICGRRGAYVILFKKSSHSFSNNFVHTTRYVHSYQLIQKHTIKCFYLLISYLPKCVEVVSYFYYNCYYLDFTYFQPLLINGIEFIILTLHFRFQLAKLNCVDKIFISIKEG